MKRNTGIAEYRGMTRAPKARAQDTTKQPKKEQAVKKGAGYKKGRTILKKKRKALRSGSAYLKGFRQSRCRMVYDLMNKAYLTILPCASKMWSLNLIALFFFHRIQS